jgi:hypothetical protein
MIEDKVSKAIITKCTGYFEEGIFFGVELIDRKIMQGLDTKEADDKLQEECRKVFEQDVIKDMQARLAEMN